MSINLALEKPETTEEPAVRYTKRIDDLIEDAEIEAEIEAERKIRAKNTKIVAISTVAIGLLGLLYYGISYQTEAPGTPTVESPRIAQTPPAVPPKPIPFPVNGNEPSQVSKPPVAASPEKKAPAPAARSAKSRVQTAQKDSGASKVKSPAPAQKTQASATPSRTPSASRQGFKLPPATRLNPEKTVARSFQQTTQAGLSGYFIQVGAFSRKANADRLAKKLRAAGFQPILATKTVGEKTVHVVRVGGFKKVAGAKSAQESLRAKGFKNTFISQVKSG